MAIALALDFITAPELAPTALIEAAAANGCGHVSLFVRPPPSMPDHGLLESAEARRETRAALRATGVRVDMIEAFLLAPETDVADFAPAFAAGAEIGATIANALIRDDDPGRRTANLARFAELAARFGMRPMVEFFAQSSLSSLALALEAIRAAGVGTLGVEVDALHLFRTGGAPADLAAIPPALFARAQICDGPRAPPPDPGFEAARQRVIPGEGGFPLHDFVRALPEGIVLGVEVPLADMAARGVPAGERIRRSVAATRRIVAEAGRATARL